MSGIGIDRLNQRGDEVRSPPELHIDLGPGVIDLVPPPKEPDVDDDRDGHQHHHDRKNDDVGHEQSFRQPEGPQFHPTKPTP